MGVHRHYFSMHRQHNHPASTTHKSGAASTCSYMSLASCIKYSPAALQVCLSKMEELLYWVTKGLEVEPQEIGGDLTWPVGIIGTYMP
uniref:Uncharacterized protein n=1 Tax=Oryza meridionalis TaxID=40149 RepID=A0A0E0F3G3_9ORYZ